MGGFSAKALVGSEIYLLLATVRTTPNLSLQVITIVRAWMN